MPGNILYPRPDLGFDFGVLSQEASFNPIPYGLRLHPIPYGGGNNAPPIQNAPKCWMRPKNSANVIDVV